MEPELYDYMNEMRREHRGVGRQEMLNNVIQLKANMRGGLLSSDHVEAMKKEVPKKLNTSVTDDVVRYQQGLRYLRVLWYVIELWVAYYIPHGGVRSLGVFFYLFTIDNSKFLEQYLMDSSE